jgi:hypothetical protein
MTPLPTLANWERSSHSLHKAAMLLGAIRQLVRPREANYLELALRIESNLLSTDRLPTGGNILLESVAEIGVSRPYRGLSALFASAQAAYCCSSTSLAFFQLLPVSISALVVFV